MYKASFMLRINDVFVPEKYNYWVNPKKKKRCIDQLILFARISPFSMDIHHF